LLVAVNKMDLVGFSRDVFDRIVAEYGEFAARLGVADLKFIPISALGGDNVVEWSPRMPWYHGGSVLEHLESVYIGGDRNLVDLRLPIQYVIRPHQGLRGYAGQIASGVLRVGEEVLALPSMRTSRITSIRAGDDEREYAFAPMSPALGLARPRPEGTNPPRAAPPPPPQTRRWWSAMGGAGLVWGADEPMDVTRPYVVKHTTRTTRATIQKVAYRMDVNVLSRCPA